MSEKHWQKHILATTTEKHNLYSTKQTDNSKLTLIYCRLPAKCKEPRQIDSQSNIVRVEFVYAERCSQLPPHTQSHTPTHSHTNFIQAFHLCVLRTTRHDTILAWLSPATTKCIRPSAGIWIWRRVFLVHSGMQYTRRAPSIILIHSCWANTHSVHRQCWPDTTISLETRSNAMRPGEATVITLRVVGMRANVYVWCLNGIHNLCLKYQ